MNASLIDKRIIERIIIQGKITKEEYQKHLHNLKDLSNKYDNITPKIFSDNKIKKQNK